MVNNGKITAPVGIADVKAVLGSPSNDLGTLCTHPNVQLWARYKPAKGGTIASAPNTCGMRGGGLSITNQGVVKVFNGSEEETGLSGGDNGWTWDKPTGGRVSPYRLGDFNGYNHNAVCEATGERLTWDAREVDDLGIVPLNPTGGTLPIGGTIGDQLNWDVTTMDGSSEIIVSVSKQMVTADCVKFGNLPVTKDCYFGALFFKIDKDALGGNVLGDCVLATSSRKLSEDGAWQVSLMSSYLTNGTWNILPLFCKRDCSTPLVSNGAVPITGYIGYAVPNTKIRPLYVDQAGFGFTIFQLEGYAGGTSNTIRMVLDITASKAMTLTGSWTTKPKDVTNVTLNTTGTVNVNAVKGNQQQQFDVTFKNGIRSNAYDLTVQVTLSSGSKSITRSINIASGHY